MTFIKAVINANQEVFSYLKNEGLMAKDYQSFDLGAGGDISSGIDLEAEKIFIKYLSPFGTIISEESGEIASSHEGIRIILDPIDGSDNLLSHLPYFGTSVAYMQEEKCTQAIITNLANGDIFIKNDEGFKRAHLMELAFKKVQKNPFSKVGIFERSYCSSKVLPKLHSLGLKYRSPGAFALSLAYAHDVSFVLYEGKMRPYDIAAGMCMCEDLHTFMEDDIFLVSKDKETFDKIVSLFKSD